MARKHATHEEETEINITPMLDIVFIMLIFFIVSTSFIKETGIEVLRPQAQTAQKKDRGNILIAISDTGQIWMHKKRVDLTEVRGMVESARKETPESSAIIVADVEAQTGLLIDLMDQVRLGGVGNISVAAQEVN
ncbi:MAG: biopolymer transporter ExbD [Gammaproteobacteria bacterium]|nr:biopolymer transporter ExbD [Gammaproteobacteria bacterium]NNF61627.1 biopolymer transporter ExbD [Gammaproteobacteria bacterium]NNM20567.1 biopolymer transporter ExbD [Gammaproteobacteria bacterium]